MLLCETEPQVEPRSLEAGLRGLVDVMRRQEAGVRLLSIDIPPTGQGMLYMFSIGDREYYTCSFSIGDRRLGSASSPLDIPPIGQGILYTIQYTCSIKAKPAVL